MNRVKPITLQAVIRVSLIVVICAYSLRTGFSFGETRVDLIGKIPLLIALASILLIFTYRLKAYKGPGDIAACIFAALLTYQIYRSSHNADGMLYYVLMMSNLIVYVFASRYINIASLGRINIHIYIFGVLFYTLLMTVYLTQVALAGGAILDNPALWDPETIKLYEVQFGEIIAFQGLTGDPNFVGPATAIFLFIGLYSNFGKYKILSYYGNSIFFMAIFFSNSRGALLAVFLSMGVSFIINSKSATKSNNSLLSLVSIFTAALVIASFLGAGASNPFAKLEKGADRRLLEWGTVLEASASNPLLGMGLGFNKETIGKQAENGFITLIAETGLLGLFAFAMIPFITIRRFVKNESASRNLSEMRPWIAYVIYLIIAMMYTSVEASPSLWIALAIIASYSTFKQPNNRLIQAQ